MGRKSIREAFEYILGEISVPKIKQRRIAPLRQPKPPKVIKHKEIRHKIFQPRQRFNKFFSRNKYRKR